MAKEIKIQIDDETSRLRVDVVGSITFPELVRSLFTVLLHNMEQTAELGKDVPGLRGEIYDMVNAMASNTLDAFEPLPKNGADQLTAEAILRAENEILDEVGDGVEVEDEDEDEEVEDSDAE